MSDIAIRAESLSKRYRIGLQEERHDTLASTLTAFLCKPAHNLRRLRRLTSFRSDGQHDDSDIIWALRNLSFEVRRGEVVGIIGRNGAGKSTLLKILSRITHPTSGRVTLVGRVSSLLEVGTGFHPELTGRENIYLNGTILGMTKTEIDKKFNEIVAFSGVEKYIDTPVKFYSSGMRVRLAFSVAAHLEPEILMVDEVLAVGDAEFQKKCLGKMGNIAREGRTVLFVSHNMAAVQNLCTNCIWIDEGTVRQMGETTEVINTYLEKAYEQSFQGEMKLADWPNRYGRGGVRIVSAKLLDANNNVTTRLFRMQPMSLEFEFESNSAHTILFSAIITAESGARILHLSQYDTPGLSPDIFSGKQRVQFSIPTLPLAEGNYRFLLGIHTESQEPLDVVTDVLSFEVNDAMDSPRPFKTLADIAYCWTPNQCFITPVD